MHPNESSHARQSPDVQSASEALAERIGRWAGNNNRLVTAIPGLTLNAWDAPTDLTHYVHEPSLCLIAQAIDWLRDNYTQPLRIDDLAIYAKMSTSSFHRHFRAVTTKSPLQFQKLLRLHEARRMMLTDNLDAATAAFQVGYESHSQFNREYSRLFGAPPLRDIKKIRQFSIEPQQSHATPAPVANHAAKM